MLLLHPQQQTSCATTTMTKIQGYVYNNQPCGGVYDEYYYKIIIEKLGKAMEGEIMACIHHLCRNRSQNLFLLHRRVVLAAGSPVGAQLLLHQPSYPPPQNQAYPSA
jgi:hypothetical protein